MTQWCAFWLAYLRSQLQLTGSWSSYIVRTNLKTNYETLQRTWDRVIFSTTKNVAYNFSSHDLSCIHDKFLLFCPLKNYFIHFLKTPALNIFAKMWSFVSRIFLSWAEKLNQLDLVAQLAEHWTCKIREHDQHTYSRE